MTHANGICSFSRARLGLLRGLSIRPFPMKQAVLVMQHFSKAPATRCLFVLFALACLVPFRAAAAQQDDPPADPPAVESETDEPGAPRKERLLDQLREWLSGKSDKQSGDNPLERAVRGMRAARERIAQKNTGPETRALQEQAVKDLEELLNALKQPPPPSDKSQQNQSSSKLSFRQPQTTQAQPESEPQPGAGQQAGAPPQQAGKKTEKERNAANSADRLDKGKADAAEQARRDRIAKDVWGHLPPHVRQELLNVYREKFLPKYEDLVRRYYEALAEGEK